MIADDLMLYVSCAGTNEILYFSMDPASGELTARGAALLPGTTASLSPSAGAMRPSFSIPMAVSPDGAFLYAVLRSEPMVVLSYRIHPATGVLEPLGEASVPASTPYMHTDRSGRFLFGAAYQGDCVWVSAIDEDGRVSAPPHQIIGGINNPHCILPHPDNSTVYVAAATGDEILPFRFDAERGRLEPLDVLGIRLAPNTRPRHLAFHPGADLLYCITEAHALVDVYAIDPTTRALTPLPELGSRLPGDPASPHTVAADLHITPDGRFLYGSERTCSTICAFAIEPGSGALSLIDAFPTDRLPRSFALDPRGRFLVAAGQETGRIVVYAIDRETGRLSEGTPYDAGAGAGWVEIVELRNGA